MTTALATHPTTVPELLAASGEAARELAGADRSAWNGHIVESSSVMLGLAHWDGTLYLDRESIVDPLRHLYEHAGETLPTPTLVAYRESLATLLHEHAHFLGPEGASQEAAREAFTKPGSRQLEEGVTEAWAQDHLDDFIHRLGLDKVAPGIDLVESTGYYPAFVPAVRRITTDLDVRGGLRPGDTLAQLNRQTAAGQFPLLVDLVCDSHDLADAPTRARLESILRSGLAHLETHELEPSALAAKHSLGTATQILTDLRRETHPARHDDCALPPPTPIRSAPSPHHSALSGIAVPTLRHPAAAHTRAQNAPGHLARDRTSSSGPGGRDTEGHGLRGVRRRGAAACRGGDGQGDPRGPAAGRG